MRPSGLNPLGVLGSEYFQIICLAFSTINDDLMEDSFYQNATDILNSLINPQITNREEFKILSKSSLIVFSI